MKKAETEGNCPQLSLQAAHQQNLHCGTDAGRFGVDKLAVATVSPGPQLDNITVQLAGVIHSTAAVVPTYWWNCSSGNVLWIKISTDTAKQTCPQAGLLAIAT